MDEAINGSSVRIRRTQRMKQYLDPIWWLPALVFAAAAVVLGYHAAPGITFHDSGEFVMAAYSAGIPHPPRRTDVDDSGVGIRSPVRLCR